jgi:hypothetical protein
MGSLAAFAAGLGCALRIVFEVAGRVRAAFAAGFLGQITAAAPVALPVSHFLSPQVGFFMSI